MNLATLPLPDVIGLAVGFMLSLTIFSYVIGDNPLFRVGLSLFVGVSAGYAAIVAWYNVVWPQLILPLFSGSQAEQLFVLFPLLLSALLLFKISPRLARLGNPAVAFMVGAGVATAIGGATLGTIFPQAAASMNLFSAEELSGGGDWLWGYFRGGLILFGTLATLAYFHFGARSGLEQAPRRRQWIEWLAWIGKIFIAVTLGSVFAGIYLAALTALVERIYFLGNFIFALFQM